MFTSSHPYWVIFVFVYRIAFLLFIISFGQVKAQDGGYFVKKSTQKIVLDGVLDEADWQQAQVLTNFMQQFPTDSLKAESQTEVRITYDDQYIYFSGKMYAQKKDRTYVTPSLRRDFRGAANDALVFTIDTFLDNTNAFQFGVNPFGVQREGLLSNGGTRGDDLDLSWDNKWKVEAKQYEGYWIAEGAIPFKSLRYKKDASKWNIKFYRVDSETGERSVSAATPQNFRIFSLAFMNRLVFDKPLKKPSTNVVLIPYVASGINRDFDDPEQNEAQSNVSVGGDAKIGIGPSLNLDLTINPDFSQVEVDQQVTNLDRFEIFFPEKRQFFLENADLFAEFGHPLSRPFFSRRIGVAIDTSTGQNIQNKIHFGARLSGKLDNNWRIGVLNMQAAKEEDINLPSTNYTVAALQRKVFGRSNIGAIFVNRQVVEDSTGEFSIDKNNYSRVLGIDYNLASMDNKWTGKIFYHREFDQDGGDGNFSHAAYILYNSKTWTFSYAQVLVGDEYDAHVGYAPRNDFFRINPEIGHNFFPKSSWINQHSITADAEYFWKQGKKTDHRYSTNYNIQLQNTGSIQLSVNQRYTFLFEPFDPTRTEGIELAAGTDYTYNSFEFNYQSDFRRKIGYSLGGYIGEYFNGSRYNLRSDINMRFQPYGALALTVNYNKIELPAPYNSADLFLIGPRFDLTMTKKLFLTTFVQYNSQIENVNINARLQWRFKPVSDIFLVYTDNYGTEDQFGETSFIKKNRALVFKITYWLNL
ncbi:hydrolase [Fulvivirga lutimaris]|nr:hydrolase [Fulvivirga lutimaris]